jgi:hypothetical protein
LVAPTIPEITESVQHEDDLTFTRRDIVQLDPIARQVTFRCRGCGMGLTGEACYANSEKIGFEHSFSFFGRRVCVAGYYYTAGSENPKIGGRKSASLRQNQGWGSGWRLSWKLEEWANRATSRCGRSHA